MADNVMWDADSNVSSLSASSDGKIVYRTGAMEERQFVWHDRSGARIGVVTSPDLATPWDVNFGVNDRRVATRRVVDGKNPDIWLIESTELTKKILAPAPASAMFLCASRVLARAMVFCSTLPGKS